MFDPFSSGESDTAVLDRPEPRLESLPPRLQTRPDARETISGNRYDLVLANQPDAGDHYSFYDRIVNLVENRGLRIYSPHTDIKGGHDLDDTVTFTTTEAIPRTRGVMVHLTTVTPDIKKMFEATHKNNRPFVVFYSMDTSPFGERGSEDVINHQSFRGRSVYVDEEHAITLLERQLQELTQGQ